MEISGKSPLKLHYKCNVTHYIPPFEFPFSITCQQVDAYGLCAIVHMMLHSSYMEVVKKEQSDGSYMYLPKLPFKRYVPSVILYLALQFFLRGVVV